jgi:hypothetical protein
LKRAALPSSISPSDYRSKIKMKRNPNFNSSQQELELHSKLRAEGPMTYLLYRSGLRPPSPPASEAAGEKEGRSQGMGGNDQGAIVAGSEKGERSLNIRLDPHSLTRYATQSLFK